MSQYYSSNSVNPNSGGMNNYVSQTEQSPQIINGGFKVNLLNREHSTSMANNSANGAASIM
jgi:hypothetical protein